MPTAGRELGSVVALLAVEIAFCLGYSIRWIRAHLMRPPHCFFAGEAQQMWDLLDGYRPRTRSGPVQAADPVQPAAGQIRPATCTKNHALTKAHLQWWTKTIAAAFEKTSNARQKLGMLHDDAAQLASIIDIRIQSRKSIIPTYPKNFRIAGTTSNRTQFSSKPTLISLKTSFRLYSAMVLPSAAIRITVASASLKNAFSARAKELSVNVGCQPDVVNGSKQMAPEGAMYPHFNLGSSKVFNPAMEIGNASIRSALSRASRRSLQEHPRLAQQHSHMLTSHLLSHGPPPRFYSTSPHDTTCQ